MSLSSSSSSSSRVPCPHCAKDFKNKGSLRGHVRKLHGKTEAIEESSPQEVVVGPQDAVSVPLHPVLDMDIMNISADDFKGCRMAPDGRISVYDAIQMFMAPSDRPARFYWSKILEKTKGSDFGTLESFQFPGARQQVTPITTFTNLLQILSLLPGPKAKALRSQQAQLSARAVAGDVDLEAALPVQRERVGEEMQAVLMSGLESSSSSLPPPPSTPAAAEPPPPAIRAHVSVWMDICEQQAKNFAAVEHIVRDMKTWTDERDKVYARDIHRQLSRKRVAELMSSPKQQLLNFEGGKEAKVVGPEEEPAGPRRELSIPLLATEMGLNARKKGAEIGKVMVVLWRKKHGLDEKAQPTKRDTIFQGRPIKENAYYEEDEDILRQAIQQVCGVE